MPWCWPPAGLRRLGWHDRIAEILEPEQMCPAVGQGALAIETRDDNGAGYTACRRLNHAPTEQAVTAERAVLRTLGGGCQVPIGAHATVTGDALFLRAVVIAPDGSIVIRREAEGAASDACSIGEQLGAELMENGAREILETVYGDGANG